MPILPLKEKDFLFLPCVLSWRPACLYAGEGDPEEEKGVVPRFDLWLKPLLHLSLTTTPLTSSPGQLHNLDAIL